LQQVLSERGVVSDCLTGSVPLRERSGVINRLLDGEVRVLIVTSAGGEGINLQDGADAVLLLTPWFSHMVLDQAADRVYRFGQTHEVDVYRLVSHGTVEERMVRMQDRKYESVSLAVVQRSRSLSRLSRSDLLALLGNDDE
jgi:SNF2 family DNA or RNA helicase